VYTQFAKRGLMGWQGSAMDWAGVSHGLGRGQPWTGQVARQLGSTSGCRGFVNNFQCKVLLQNSKDQK